MADIQVHHVILRLFPNVWIHQPQDEFKVVVVEAIRSLSLKFPQKHRVLMNFLSSILREEGGFEYKKSIINFY